MTIASPSECFAAGTQTTMSNIPPKSARLVVHVVTVYVVTAWILWVRVPSPAAVLRLSRASGFLCGRIVSARMGCDTVACSSSAQTFGANKAHARPSL